MMATEKSKLISQRRELKYLVTESMARRIQDHVRPFAAADVYSRTGGPEGYLLSSLYLDSPDLTLSRQTVIGAKNRYKLRVRCYSDEPRDLVYMEIKRRVDRVVLKRRAPILRSRLADCLERRRPPGAEDTTNAEVAGRFIQLADEARARPTALVRYRREAYESIDGPEIRMTFDRKLAFRMTDKAKVELQGAGWEQAGVRGVIFEIKFNEAFPRWVQGLIATFDLEERSIPKYVISLDKAGLINPGHVIWESRV